MVAPVLVGHVTLALGLGLVLLVVGACTAATGALAALVYVIRYHLTTGRQIRAIEKRQENP